MFVTNITKNDTVMERTKMLAPGNAVVIFLW